jgi:hypothetical protein
MGRLIVHIGTHKTATTTIQRHLARNRRALAARGIWYPSYDLIGKPRHYAHLGIVNAFSAQHAKLTRADAERFFRDVVARSADHEATIISAEPFYRHVTYLRPNEVPGDAETYWRQREQYVEHVRALFAGASPEIVVVFRRQADYALSLYQQKIRGTRYQKNFATFRRQFWYHFDYLHQARVWARHFDRLAPLRFEDLVAERDPVGRFARHLGLDFSGAQVVDEQNISLPPDAVVIKRALNGSQLDAAAIEAAMQILMTGPLKGRIRSPGQRSLYRNRKEMLAFQKTFSEDNAALKREFFRDLPQEGPLFPDTFPRDCAFGDRLDPVLLHDMITLLK